MLLACRTTLLRHKTFADTLNTIMQYGTGPTTAAVVQVDYGLLVHSQMCMYCY